MKCSSCGAELISGTGFCRQCGVPVLQPDAASEQTTAILNQPTDESTTQRLDPRPTSPGYRDAASSSLPQSPTAPARPQSGVGRVILAVVIVIMLLGVGSIVRSVLKSRSENQNSAQISRSYIYPGSKIILDLTNEDRSGVLQMQTSEPLEIVHTWYSSSLKPDKTLQATAHMVILKKDKVTVTIVAENDTTTIVIKQSKP